MKIAKIGWHAFSFHCKFSGKSGSHYYCRNQHSPSDGKKCHVDVCEMFKDAEEKAEEKDAPVQQTTSSSTPLVCGACKCPVKEGEAVVHKKCYDMLPM